MGLPGGGCFLSIAAAPRAAPPGTWRGQSARWKAWARAAAMAAVGQGLPRRIEKVSASLCSFHYAHFFFFLFRSPLKMQALAPRPALAARPTAPASGAGRRSVVALATGADREVASAR
jgi:hypothetical protein